MTDAETRNILRALQVAYPARYRGMSNADAQTMVEQWKPLEPFSAVKAAVEEWVFAHRFHPTVADIRAIMSGPSDGESMRTAFKSMLRFRISQLKAQIKPPEKLETEAERQRSAKAQQKLTALYERYKDLLEGGTE